MSQDRRPEPEPEPEPPPEPAASAEDRVPPPPSPEAVAEISRQQALITDEWSGDAPTRPGDAPSPG